jgi:TonB family protein
MSLRRAFLWNISVLLAPVCPLFGEVKPRVLLAHHEGANHPVVQVIDGRPIIIVDDTSLSLSPHQKYEMVPFGKYGIGTVQFSNFQESGDLKKPRSQVMISGSLQSDQPINDPYLVVFSDLGGGYFFAALPDLKPQRVTQFNLEFRTGYGRSSYNLFLFSHGREIATNRTKPNLLDGLFSLEGDPNRKVQAILKVPPEYPVNLSRSNMSGAADVMISVDKWGCAVDAEVIQATHDAFGEAALKAVRNWLFNPALDQGVPIPQKVQLHIPFTLTETKKRR